MSFLYSRTDTLCIIPAAGVSRRMGRPKQLLQYKGSPLFRHTLDRSLRIFERVILVQGAVDLNPYIKDVAKSRLILVDNPDYEAGQLGSLQMGLRAAAGLDRPGYIFVWLADLPLVTDETCRLLYGQRRAAEALYPCIKQEGRIRRGHPVVFGRRAIDLLLKADPGQKAMEVIAPLDPLGLEVTDRGIFTDVDSPEDYEKLLSM